MRPSSKWISVLLFASVIAAPAFATVDNPSAQSLLDKATATAKQEKKSVFVIFHASWCGWCKKLDAMLSSEEFKPIFEKNYVIVHVDVMENEANKGLENPGGADLMSKLGGDKAGLPFFAFLTTEGVKIGDSILPKTGNMGYPAEPNEVAGFKVLLKKSAPRMRALELARIEGFLATKKN